MAPMDLCPGTWHLRSTQPIIRSFAAEIDACNSKVRISKPSVSGVDVRHQYLLLQHTTLPNKFISKLRKLGDNT